MQMAGSKAAGKQLHCDVAIVGGGLGGLALAAGLVRRGYNVRVYEAAPALRTSTGTFLVASGNGFTALDLLHPAVVPRLKELGQMINRFTGIDKPDPNKPAEVTSPGYGGVVFLQWALVQQVLADLVPETHVQCNHRATGYTEYADEGYVSVHFRDQPDVYARLVVAADGVKSALRATMIPEDPGPRYLGHMNWNALLYNPGQKVVDAHGPGEMQIWQDVLGQNCVHGKFKHMVFVLDAGGGYTTWQLRVVSEHPNFTAPAMHPDSTGAADSPSSTDQQVRDAAELQKEPEKAYLVGGGLGKPGSKARVMKIMQAIGFDGPCRLVQATDESDIFERAMLDRIPLDELGGHMSSPTGRVILLGDAAHAMHSCQGQGARIAFEGAHTLADLLDKHKEELLHGGWTFSTHNTGTSCPAGQGINPAELDTSLVGSSINDVVAHLQLQDKMVEDGQKEVSDKDVVRSIASEYEALRLVRVSRIQRYSTEGCGLERIKHQVQPVGLTPEQEWLRFQEFNRWTAQYPDNALGDPQSTYWKPPAQESC